MQHSAELLERLTQVLTGGRIAFAIYPDPRFEQKLASSRKKRRAQDGKCCDHDDADGSVFARIPDVPGGQPSRLAKAVKAIKSLPAQPLAPSQSVAGQLRSGAAEAAKKEDLIAAPSRDARPSLSSVPRLERTCVDRDSVLYWTLRAEDPSHDTAGDTARAGKRLHAYKQSVRESLAADTALAWDHYLGGADESAMPQLPSKGKVAEKKRRAEHADAVLRAVNSDNWDLHMQSTPALAEHLVRRLRLSLRLDFRDGGSESYTSSASDGWLHLRQMRDGGFCRLSLR